MKTAVILLGLFVAFVAADTGCPVIDAIVKGYHECANMTDASRRTLRNVQRGGAIHDEDTNCFRACMMDEAGFITNEGKIDVDKMVEMTNESCHPLARRAYLIFARVAEFCNKYVVVSEDECQTTHNYMKCFKAARKAYKYAKKKAAMAWKAEEQRSLAYKQRATAYRKHY